METLGKVHFLNPKPIGFTGPLPLGHFQVGAIIGALQKVYTPYRSLIEALKTLNSPPVVSFNFLDWIQGNRPPLEQALLCTHSGGLGLWAVGLRVSGLGLGGFGGFRV